MDKFHIKNLMEQNFFHFNAKATLDASKEYKKQINKGHYMLLALAGAMSTAEIGRSLSKMIKANKVHAISCTGANLEEDIMNLIGKDSYKHIPNWRHLTKNEEELLNLEKMNRITDVCIPEQIVLHLRSLIYKYWKTAETNNQKFAPYEYFYQMIKAGDLNAYKRYYANSWVIAAAEKNIPIFTPGWEDSTLGNLLVASNINYDIKNLNIVKTGLEQMKDLVKWYTCITQQTKIGFFQIGGGISGDFAICTVPLIRQDLFKKVPLWSFFCQISDSTTSYGSYSGAYPSEKITWEKIDKNTPSFIIESDASIVVPLMFYYILSD